MSKQKLKKTAVSCEVKVNDTAENRKGKDSFFKEVFQSEENLRSVAGFLLHGDADTIKISKVKPVIFGNKENDLSFMCNDILYTMLEAQSSSCINIPFRLLEYCTSGLLSNADDERLLYGKDRVYLPIPKLYTVRTGIEAMDTSMNEVVSILKLSDSYKDAEIEKQKGFDVDPDLDLKVHLYDFRMTKGETLDYIEKAVIPERLKSYQSILFDYALFANSFTYLLVTKSRNYKMPQNVKNIMELIMLLKDRGIFVELFERKEVCDMVAANFSAENIKRYEYMEEGRTKGRLEGILEGRHEGKLEGKAEAIFNLLQNGGTEEQARRFLLATSDQIAEAKIKLSMKS